LSSCYSCLPTEVHCTDEAARCDLSSVELK
jgi:hypothetical protein